MKKITTLILAIFTLLLVTSCNNTEKNDEQVQVIFYKYRNAFVDQEDKAKTNTIFVDKGVKIEMPEDTQRPGYGFLGWYKDYNYTQVWDFDNDTIEKNTILFAKWEIEYYKLFLDLNGGQFRDAFKGEYDENGNPFFTYSIDDGTNLPRLTKTGYKFLGWFPTDTYVKGSKPDVRIPSTLFGNTTYYGHWEIVNVNVSFRLNSTNETDPKTINIKSVDYGDIIDFVVPVDLTGEYEFVGWNSKADGTGTFYNNGDVFERTVRLTLYAIWEEK